MIRTEANMIDVIYEDGLGNTAVMDTVRRDHLELLTSRPDLMEKVSAEGQRRIDWSMARVRKGHRVLGQSYQGVVIRRLYLETISHPDGALKSIGP